MELDPRQELFASYYTNPKSETFSNAYRSALKAGYTEEYSKTIVSRGNDWVSELVRDKERLRKAEKVLDKTLELETVDDNGKVDTAVLKIQTDVSKFITERLGKNKYSTRQEVTGKDGKDLIPDRSEADKAIDELLNGHNQGNTKEQ